MGARTKERREQIVALAKQDGFVSVVSLAELFRVSEVTIRSDLDVLESHDLLVRTHGGAYCTEKRRHTHKIASPMGRLHSSMIMTLSCSKVVRLDGLWRAGCTSDVA
jgi:DeoR/GlpR family transcriptional regulator of sugar metabolism